MKRYNCIRLFVVIIVCLLVLLSGSLAHPVSAQTLKVVIVEGSEKVWSTVVERFKKEHPGTNIELVTSPITALRAKLRLSAAAGGWLDVVMVDQAWLHELAEIGLEDLTKHKEELRKKGIDTVRYNDKIFGGKWPRPSGWVVSVFKHSKHKKVAFELLVAAMQVRAETYAIIIVGSHEGIFQRSGELFKKCLISHKVDKDNILKVEPKGLTKDSNTTTKTKKIFDKFHSKHKKNLGPEDTIYLYLVGHGAGSFFVLDINSAMEGKEPPSYKKVHFDSILKWLEGLPPATVNIVVDCCESGMAVFHLERFRKKVSSPKRHTIITSEGPKIKGSYWWWQSGTRFTRTLVGFLNLKEDLDFGEECKKTIKANLRGYKPQFEHYNPCAKIKVEKISTDYSRDYREHTLTVKGKVYYLDGTRPDSYSLSLELSGYQPVVGEDGKILKYKFATWGGKRGVDKRGFSPSGDGSFMETFWMIKPSLRYKVVLFQPRLEYEWKKEIYSELLPIGTLFKKPHRKQILSQDNFSNSGSGWSVSTNDERKKTYKNGKYSITVKKPNWQFISWAPGKSFPADFEVKVDARQVAGPTGKYGIIWGKDGDNYYVFTISSDGRYRLRKRVKDVWQTNPVSWTNSPVIKRGTGSNQLKVNVTGNSITLIVNDAVLTTVKGSSFGPGKIGLVGGSFDDTGVEVQFDNLKIEGLALPFKDNFSNSGSGWSVSTNDERKKTYKNGKYSITVKKPNWQFISWAPGKSFPADFEVKVDARQVAGPTGKYGIIWGKDGDNYYVFTISSDGRYRLRKRVKDVWQTNPVSWTNSPVIKRGTGSNQLKVNVTGNSITLIVNDAVLTTVKGSSFGPGKIGLVGGSFDDTGVEVQFDNLTI